MEETEDYIKGEYKGVSLELCEADLQTKSTDSKGNTHTTTTYHYYYNDIIVVNISPKGDIDWTIKIEKTRSHGAKIVLYDLKTEKREVIDREISNQTGAIVVPSYDDPYILAGQGTSALEVIEDLVAAATPSSFLCTPVRVLVSLRD